MANINTIYLEIKKALKVQLAMFLVLILTLGVVLAYYHVSMASLLIIPVVALVATVFEGITPKGLDNLTACFSAVGAYSSC